MQCNICEKWTGNEKNGYGTCLIKQSSKDEESGKNKNFITCGSDECSEESDENIRKIFLKS